MPSYSLMLVVSDDLLLKLASIIGADYVPGTFDMACEALHEDDDAYETTWTLAGEHAVLTVLIERGEGYLSCSIAGEGPEWQAARELMWERLVAGGANVRGVRNPWGGRGS